MYSSKIFRIVVLNHQTPNPILTRFLRNFTFHKKLPPHTVLRAPADFEGYVAKNFNTGKIKTGEPVAILVKEKKDSPAFSNVKSSLFTETKQNSRRFKSQTKW